MSQADEVLPPTSNNAQLTKGGKKVYITRTWWEEIKKLPDFEEIMKRKGLSEDDVEVI